MKIYLTARASNESAVKEAERQLLKRGHEITFRWWDDNLPSAKPFKENRERAAWYAQKAIQGVIDADVYIIFASPDGNGVFAELGAALVRSTQKKEKQFLVYAIGTESDLETLFYHHPAISWRSNLELVLQELEDAA